MPMVVLLVFLFLFLFLFLLHFRVRMPLSSVCTRHAGSGKAMK